MDRILLIGYGKAGWHASGLTESGSFSSSGGTLEEYAKEASDGTPIYDANNADYEAFVSFIISGPMVGHKLAKGQVRAFDSSMNQRLMSMLPGLEGAFKNLAAARLAGLTSFDYIATSDWLELLRASVPGVKFGTVQSGVPVWGTKMV